MARPDPNAAITFDEAVALVMEPGENVGYSQLLARLNKRVPSFNLAGIGVHLHALAFRGYADAWRGSEFVTYRVPYFDYEDAGNWTEGELRIVRKDAEHDG